MQSSQSAFQEQHMTDFADVALFDLGEVDDGIDENMVMDDIFTPDWDSKYCFLRASNSQFGKQRNILHVRCFSFSDDVQMTQASPERSRAGSPNGMEDNRSRQSMGHGGGNNGSGRNNQLQQDSEEVRIALKFEWLSFLPPNFDTHSSILLYFRLVQFCSSHWLSAIWCRQHQLAVCQHGSGLPVHIWKTFVRSF